MIGALTYLLFGRLTYFGNSEFIKQLGMTFCQCWLSQLTKNMDSIQSGVLREEDNGC